MKKNFYHNKIFTIFNIFFVLLLFFPIATSLFYPIELEVRESTLWLHVLTLKSNVGLYDSSFVAYANHAHGPFDPIFKYFISNIFSFLEPWQISRSSNLFFFISIYLTFFTILKKYKFPINSILFFASLFFSLILIFTKGYQGRADITALFLLIALIFVVINFSLNSTIFRIFNPLLVALVILTNWRFLPIVFSISLFFLLEDFVKKKYSIRKINVKKIVEYLFILTLVPIAILHLQFDFELKKYYDYFFNFFYFESHFSSTYIKGGLTSLLKVEKFFVLILFCVTIFYYFVIKGLLKRNVFPFYLTFFGIILITIFQFLYNYNGGGIYYFTPVVLITFFLFFHTLKNFLFYNSILQKNKKIKYLLISLIFLIVINAGKFSAIASFKMITTYNNAQDLHLELSRLNQHETLSESMHFQKKMFTGEKIDIGDLMSYRSSQVGGEYQKIYLDHIEDIKKKKYTYIIHNFTGSSIIGKLIKENKYRVVRTFKGSNFYSNTRDVLVLKKNVLSK
tara:strand:- start:4715 stop:6244 length:1530 start_codon:yes stop_codon:yes gene_type:complete